MSVRYVIVDEYGRFTAVSNVHPPKVHDDRYYRKDQTYWLQPVSAFDELPLSGNKHGDARLTLDNKKVWIWVESAGFDQFGNPVFIGDWLPVIGNYWGEPVEAYGDLPLTGNLNGEVRLVLELNTIYRWNGEYSVWQTISGGGAAGSWWLAPVSSEADLPLTGNIDGHVRLTKDTNDVFRWDQSQSDWIDIHASLAAKLLPPGHDPLSGDIPISPVYNGFLSDYSGSGTYFVDYSPGDAHNGIINSLPVNSGNINFGPADKGALYLYKNAILIDTLDLIGNFNESERAGNQSGVPWTSGNGYIIATFIGMYNNVPFNQYGTFHIVFNSGWIVPGDNPNIEVRHQY